MQSKLDKIFLEYLKSPFDEQDAKELCNSSTTYNDLMKITLIWGMFKAAELTGSTKKLQNVLSETNEDEDLL